MANDNDSVDSNGNSTDLRPRRSNRAKGKPIQQLEDTDENVVVHNNVVYKVGDFVYYLEKKQDIYRIGLIEEFKHQKRDKLVNKRPEISVKQFYRLDEIPASVLSNQGEYDTHVMPPNFPEWLRQREIFISDNALSTSCSSLKSLCTVRHFPDLNHAMALFSTSQSSGQVTNSSPRVDHHSLINGKDNCCIPIPKQRDDNTFFYVYSYNARGRKLAATYLEIRVGPAYQAELPELRSLDDQQIDSRYVPGAREQLMWKPNQIPEEVFNVYNMATISIACFSGFGGGVDDTASVENGRKIASHMLTCQKALDCLHKAQYIMEKAMEIFAENSLPEVSTMPFLWTDEDHLLFDESVKIHGKNFLRIKQDKRNKKGRLVGDYVTFYYYWKKNRPKNRKYTAKKNLRSRVSNVPLSEQTSNQDGNDLVKKEPTLSSTENNNNEKPVDGDNISPSDLSIECCINCKIPLPKSEEELSTENSDKTVLSDRMKSLCYKCQHYLRRYGYQRPLETVEKIKASDDDEDEAGDFEEGTNGFDEEEDEEEIEGEEEEEDDIFQQSNSPHNNIAKETIIATTAPTAVTTTTMTTEENSSSTYKPSSIALLENKNSLAINKYDFDEEDENVEEVSSLLKRNQAKHHLLRESTDTKTSNYKIQTNGSSYAPSKTISNYPNNPQFNKSASSSSLVIQQATKTSSKQTNPQSSSSNKRNSLLKKSTSENSKKRKLDTNEETAISRSSSVTSRNSRLNPSVRKHIHESLKSTLSHTHSEPFGKNIDGKKVDMNSSQYDSNSSSSSSSSTSNDSSSSSDEAGILPLLKRTTASLKLDSNKELKGDTSPKDAADNSYNQMITSIPNIPGVCAVTNVGEPMPQFMANLSTDLSASNQSSVSDLNITVAEPLYKQLSLRPVVTASTTSVGPAAGLVTSTSSPGTTISDSTACGTNKAALAIASCQQTTDSKFVNFNNITNLWTEGNPEETGLNLVKPKKRIEPSLNEHNWAPPHENPSKLVHHRGDSSLADCTAIEPLRQMINDNEVIHGSIFGHIVRVVRTGEGCARTDLQHTTNSLKSADLEKKRIYINNYKVAELSSSNNVILAGQEHCKKVVEEAKKPGTMPPPHEKNLVHHPSTSKHFNIPPLTHSSNNNQSPLLNQAHNRKVSNCNSSSHNISSPSSANSRPQSSFSSLPPNMIRHPSNHIHNSGLHNTPNNIRPNMHMNPNMQSVSNNTLLNDYNNMNKVNMSDLIYFQNMTQSIELQKLAMMYNLPSMPPVRPIQWDQRDRFGSTADNWNGVLGNPGMVQMGPGGLPMGHDIQSMLRAIGQSPQSNVHNRPRSAAGLNLTNGNNNPQNNMPGSSGSHGNDKPGSGRASVNHDFPSRLQQQQQQQQQDSSLAAAENTELMESLQMFINMQKGHHQINPPPPVAHALNNLAGVVNAFSSPHVGGIPQNLLAQMQAQSSSASSKPPNPPFGSNCPIQFLQLLMGLNQPR